MKKLILILAMLALMQPFNAQAQEPVTSWTEIGVTVAGMPYVGAQRFTLEPSMSVANFNGNRGLGFFFGRTSKDSAQAGPLFAWRMVEPNLMPGFNRWNVQWSWFLYTEANFGDGQVDNDARWGIGMRVDAGQAKQIDFDFRCMVDTHDEMKTKVTPAFALVFYP